MSKKIPLSQGKFAIVDDEDYEFLMQWKWCCDHGYAARTRPGRGNGSVYMHRVILERMGFKDFEQCDHKNLTRADNRRRNLRPATRSQNNCNCRKQPNNTSGFVGVNWHKQREKWRAYIGVNGKHKHLGLFEDKKEAARAYDEAAKKHYGEFAVLNMKE